MSKHHSSCLSLFLLLCILVPCSLTAEDLVALKNLSWEEQPNSTRIVMETSQPLVYSVTASESSSEFAIELSNLDLRNLPQELFISTEQVVSLRTFPKTNEQQSRIVVQMASPLEHEVVPEANKLLIYVRSAAAGDGLLAPSASPVSAPPAVSQAPETKVEDQPVTPVAETKPVDVPEAKPAAPTPETAMTAPEPAIPEKPATEVRQIRVDRNDVILVGDGSFEYDVFELNNPQRIVVDLKAVSVGAGVKNVMGTETDLFSRVRVAQYQTAPRIARAVVDLNRKVPYSVVSEGKELRIRIGEQMESSMPAAEPVIEPEPPQVDPMMASGSELDSQPAVMAQAEQPAAVNSEPATTGPVSNEQFFTIQPDTSLFAQSSGSEVKTLPTPTYRGGVSFEEKTLRSDQRQYTGEPFSFDFKDIDIKDLFRFIADISSLNVILDPAVKGSVTLKLTEVPWDQALDLITRNQGLGYTIEGNVIRIAPMNKIKAEAKEREETLKQQELSAPLVTKIKPISYAKANEVDTVIRKLLSPKGTSIIDKRTNTLIITEIDTNIDNILSLIDTLDSRTAQVMIETRIVETQKNFSQAFGIQWGFRGIVDPAFGNNTTLQFPNNLLVSGDNLTPTQGGIGGNPLGGYAVNLPTSQAPNSAVLLSAGNILDTFRLDMALMALENTGNGRVISSPKVMTQNNTSAEIVQGFQIPVQTVANNTITTTFVKAALRLEVTPQITAEGTVILQVNIENNRPDFTNNNVFGIPPLFTESATTTLLVEDGGTTVIGGIFRAEDAYSSGKTPVLHRIPLLGWLFKNTNVTRQNTELLIFLTPRIVRQ